MFLLIGESTHIYSLLVSPSLQGTLVAAIGAQFDHHEWHGLHFWDLVQPFFMFIVGVALPFSAARRDRCGESGARITRHAVQRAVLLLLLGWALYCIGPGRITFRFQNVLAQLSVTYLVAFLMMRRRFAAQAALTAALLVLTEALYRFFPVAGFDQPFVPDHNFGSWVDLLISGELSDGHWVSFNAIPTIAHTMWGVLAGQWLMSGRAPREKITRLVLVGAALIVAGFALDPVDPIIKRICTASFVIVSGGFCLVALALSYWVIDARRMSRPAGTPEGRTLRTEEDADGPRARARNPNLAWVTFFTIVGMNSLFIYLFTESGGTAWLVRLVRPFTMAVQPLTGALPAQILTSLAAWAVLWGMCYWLYRRRIVIKI